MDYLFNNESVSNDEVAECYYIVDDVLKYLSFKESPNRYDLYYADFDCVGEFIRSDTISNNLDIFVLHRESPILSMQSVLSDNEHYKRVVTIHTYHGNPTEIKANESSDSEIIERISGDSKLF